MIGRLKNPHLAAAVALGIAMLAPAAFAHTQPAAQQAPAQGSATASQPTTGPTPNDTELKHFAGAALQVQSIRQSLQPQLAAAKTDKDRTELKQAAEKKMEAAVRSHHLSIHRYVQIADVVQKNSAIRAKVQSYMPPQPQPQS